MSSPGVAPFFRTGQTNELMNPAPQRRSYQHNQSRDMIPFPQRETTRAAPARDRATPQSLESEQSTLGAMMMEHAAVARAMAIVNREDFYRELHKKIVDAILAVYDRGEKMDMILVVEELRNRNQLEEIGGAAYLSALIESCESSANVEAYARVVLDKSIARSALRELEDLTALLTVPVRVDSVGKEIGRHDYVSHIKNSRERLRDLEERRETLQAVAEYTDDRILDTLLDDVSWLWPSWIPRGSYTLLAGRPGAGKSTIAMDICKRLITGQSWPDGTSMDQEDPFEDQDAQEPAKLLWIDTESALGIFRQRLREWDFPRGHFVFAKGNELEPVRVDDDNSWRWVVQAVRDHRPPLVVLDSLSYAHSGEENSNDYMKFVMRRIADLARDFNIAVLVIHHLSKLPIGVPDWPPTQDMIRGASVIPQYARSILSVGTPDKNQPHAHGLANIKLTLGKQPEPIGYQTTEHGPAWGDVPEAGGTKPIEAARAWLRQMLSGGPMPSEDIFAACEEAGICKRRTLDTAKSDLNIVVQKESGGHGRWFWSLP